MDKIISLTPDSETSSVVMLSLIQHLRYKTSAIEVHDHNGELLEVIGHQIKKDIEETNAYKLRDELYLIESLISQINHDLELPKEAVSGLADLLFRMRDVCDLNLEK